MVKTLAMFSGSWSQLLARELKNNAATATTANATATAAANPTVVESSVRVVAVDLQEMAPIPGVSCIQGDITTVETANDIISALGGARAQLVVCDGAPDVTGLHQIDEFLQVRMTVASFELKLHHVSVILVFECVIFFLVKIGVLYVIYSSITFF